MQNKKRGQKKMEVKRINKGFSKLDVANEWNPYIIGSDPLINSWKKRIRSG